MIDKVGKRIFDPAKIIVDPWQIMRRRPAAIRRISPDPLAADQDSFTLRFPADYRKWRARPFDNHPAQRTRR
jgi:hypothetical protein